MKQNSLMSRVRVTFLRADLLPEFEPYLYSHDSLVRPLHLLWNENASFFFSINFTFLNFITGPLLMISVCSKLLYTGRALSKEEISKLVKSWSKFRTIYICRWISSLNSSDRDVNWKFKYIRFEFFFSFSYFTHEMHPRPENSRMFILLIRVSADSYENGFVLYLYV